MEIPDQNDLNQVQGSSKAARWAFILSLVMAVSGCLIITNIIPHLPGMVFMPLMYCILPLNWLGCLILSIIDLKSSNRVGNLSSIALTINFIAIMPLLFFWLLATMEGLPFICFEDFNACFGP